MNKVKQTEDLKCRNYNKTNRGINTAVDLLSKSNFVIE